MLDAYGVAESNWRDATTRSPHFAISESPAFVGRAVAALAQDPGVSRWNGKSLSSGQLAKIYGFTDLDGSQPDAWRYVTEVQDAGKPADVTGYRLSLTLRQTNRAPLRRSAGGTVDCPTIMGSNNTANDYADGPTSIRSVPITPTLKRVIETQHGQ